MMAARVAGIDPLNSTTPIIPFTQPDELTRIVSSLKNLRSG
jgi:hypothetical protein